MVNNGIVVVMVVGVGGGKSGYTLESGDTRSHPKVCCRLGGGWKSQKVYVWLPLIFRPSRLLTFFVSAKSSSSHMFYWGFEVLPVGCWKESKCYNNWSHWRILWLLVLQNCARSMDWHTALSNIASIRVSSADGDNSFIDCSCPLIVPVFPHIISSKLLCQKQ